MAGLGDTPLGPGCGRPVGGEEFAHDAGCGIDELVEAERRDVVRHAVPGRIVIDRDPGERAFEEMHVRIGALRQAVAAILEVAALRMGAGFVQCCAQRHRVTPPSGVLAEHAVRVREGKEDEGLFVEVEWCVTSLAVESDHRRRHLVRGDEMPAQIVERV